MANSTAKCTVVVSAIWVTRPSSDMICNAPLSNISLLGSSLLHRICGRVRPRSHQKSEENTNWLQTAARKAPRRGPARQRQRPRQPQWLPQKNGELFEKGSSHAGEERTRDRHRRVSHCRRTE